MSYFSTPAQVVAGMIQDFFEITGIMLSPTDYSREEIVKMWTFGGAISGMTSAIQRASDDFFPQSASEQALQNGHIPARELPDRSLAQPSNGIITVTGTVAGSVLQSGTAIKRLLNGKVVVTTAAVTLPDGLTIQVPCQSVLAGQDENIDILNDAFQLVSPVAGFNSACTNTDLFRDGRDLETPAEMLDRVQAYDLDVNTGGNLPAYEAFARAASPDVVTAHAIKNPRGVNTVNTVITSGTTDIETAVRNGDAVSRLPSGGLISTVQAYILAQNPTTDDHQTVAPTEEAFDVSINYLLYDETLRSVTDPEVLILTKIYIYQAKSGAKLEPTDLERIIDAKIGHLLSKRRVSDFGMSGSSYTVPDNKIEMPGTIAITGP